MSQKIPFSDFVLKDSCATLPPKTNWLSFLSEQLYRQIVHQSDPDSRKID